MELIETPQRHTNLQKPLDILTIPKAKFNLAFKMKRTTEKSPQTKPLQFMQKYPGVLRTPQ